MENQVKNPRKNRKNYKTTIYGQIDFGLSNYKSFKSGLVLNVRI